MGSARADFSLEAMLSWSEREIPFQQAGNTNLCVFPGFCMARLGSPRFRSPIFLDKPAYTEQKFMYQRSRTAEVKTTWLRARNCFAVWLNAFATSRQANG